MAYYCLHSNIMTSVRTNKHPRSCMIGICENSELLSKQSRQADVMMEVSSCFSYLERSRLDRMHLSDVQTPTEHSIKIYTQSFNSDNRRAKRNSITGSSLNDESTVSGEPSTQPWRRSTTVPKTIPLEIMDGCPLGFPIITSLCHFPIVCGIHTRKDD
jgi:hypothetical protein